jgi:hypothetical protein
VKILQAATEVIVGSASTAAAAAPSQSKQLLYCCGEYLQLLTSGDTHALMAPVLKMCSVCFQATLQCSGDHSSTGSPQIAGAGAKILHSATQIVLSTAGDSNKQIGALFLDVMHSALPIVHAHVLDVTHPDSSSIQQRIDGAIKHLCLHSAVLQHEVQQLLSAPSQQGLASFAAGYGSECGTSHPAEATEPQVYLQNVLFMPWVWLEQASDGAVEQQPMHEKMAQCVPQHAYWLVALCSAAPDLLSHQQAPSGRSKRKRSGADVQAAHTMQWNAFLALLHRTALTVQHILQRVAKQREKRAKLRKSKRKRKLSGAEEQLLVALDLCVMVVRACRDHKVKGPPPRISESLTDTCSVVTS